MKLIYIPTKADKIFYVLLCIAVFIVCVIVAKCNRDDGKANDEKSGPAAVTESVPADVETESVPAEK